MRTSRLRVLLGKVCYALIISVLQTWSGSAIATSLNDFQTGSTEGWQQGGASGGLSVVADSGPSGSGDFALQVGADGAGAGGKLVLFNSTTEWTGDYATKSILSLEGVVLNDSGSTLSLRAAVDGPGGRFATTSAFSVPSSSQYQPFTLNLQPGDFTAVDGGTNVASTLGNVSVLRLLHNPVPSWRGVNIVGTFLFDSVPPLVPGLRWIAESGTYDLTTPANWDPAQTPVATDDLSFGPGLANLDVNLNLTSPATTVGNDVSFSRGTVRINPAGVAFRTLNHGGDINVDDAAGTSLDDSAVVTFERGQWNAVGDTIVGDANFGTLVLQNGGALASDSLRIGNVGGSTGLLRVSGSESTVLTSSDIFVATAGSGFLDVLSGSSVVSSGNVTVADAAGSSGNVSVDGFGSTLSADGNFVVGDADGGIAMATIGAGAAATVIGETSVGAFSTLHLNGGSLTTGSFTRNGLVTFDEGVLTVDGGTFDPGVNYSLDGSSGSATVTLQGNGSASFNTLTVGDSGIAKLTIRDRYQVTLTNTNIRSLGEIVLDGGTLTTESYNSTGKLTFLSGTLALTGDELENTGALTIPDGGTLRGFGSVVSAINGLPGSTITASGGDFSSLGDNSTLGFVHEGILNVGGETVSLRSATFAQLGVLTTLVGGTLNANNGVVLGPGDNLSGHGFVNGKIAASVGSTITANSALTLGDASSPVGFLSDGELHVGGNTVTLSDSNAADLGTLTTIDGGILSIANGAIIDFTGNVTGQGTVQSPNDPTQPLINNGHIAGNSPTEQITLTGYVKGVGTLDNFNIAGTDAPGFSPATVIRGSGSYNGTLEIEIGGTAIGDFDRIEHILGAGIASLGGTLDVYLINGFVPEIGDSFGFLFAAGGFGGMFDTLDLPNLGPGKEWFLNPGGSTLLLEVRAAFSADFDLDGDVDGDDLTQWQGDYGVNDNSDADDDGDSDGADMLAWQRQFGSGLGAFATSVIVPEPAGAIQLVALIVAGFLCRSRPRLESTP